MLKTGQGVAGELGLNVSSAAPFTEVPAPAYVLTSLAPGGVQIQLAQSAPGASASESRLQPGSRGERVKDLQVLLQALGYYSGKTDGIYGKATQAAVSRFQQDVGVSPTGAVEGETWQQLRVAQTRLAEAESQSPGTTSDLDNAGDRENAEGDSERSAESAAATPPADPTAEAESSSPEADADSEAEALPSSDAAPDASSEPARSPRVWLRRLLLLMVVGVAGVGLYQAGRWSGRRERQRGGLSGRRFALPESSSTAKPLADSSAPPDAEKPSESSPSVSPNGFNGRLPDAESPSLPSAVSQEIVELNGAISSKPLTSETVPLEETTRLARVDIVQELVNDLHSHDPVKRRKAIWELGQRGSSEAIQPLSELLMDADSSQRSLILAAMSEISVRSLKPLSRALIISMQDGSADVRINAIRDITRVYDLVAQVSQVLHHAAHDEDADVQDTARWALSQIDRIRGLSDVDQLSASSPAQLTSESANPERSDAPPSA